MRQIMIVLKEKLCVYVTRLCGNHNDNLDMEG